MSIVFLFYLGFWLLHSFQYVNSFEHAVLPHWMPFYVLFTLKLAFLFSLCTHKILQKNALQPDTRCFVKHLTLIVNLFAVLHIYCVRWKVYKKNGRGTVLYTQTTLVWWIVYLSCTMLWIFEKRSNTFCYALVICWQEQLTKKKYIYIYISF